MCDRISIVKENDLLLERLHALNNAIIAETNCIHEHFR